VQEEIPWAAPHGRVTYRLEYLVLVHGQLMTQKAASQLLRLASSTFSDILHRAIGRVRDGHRIRGLTALGVDEVSYRKGHKYVTVVYDLDRSRVDWVGPGKKRETIDSFFTEQLSDYQKSQVKWACCDMSETFIGAIKTHCPHAKLVLDRFDLSHCQGTQRGNGPSAQTTMAQRQRRPPESAKRRPLDPLQTPVEAHGRRQASNGPSPDEQSANSPGSRAER
jgi:transposase